MIGYIRSFRYFHLWKFYPKDASGKHVWELEEQELLEQGGFIINHPRTSCF